LVIGHPSLVIRHWSLVIGHWLLVIGHWSFVIATHPFTSAPLLPCSRSVLSAVGLGILKLEVPGLHLNCPLALFKKMTGIVTKGGVILMKRILIIEDDDNIRENITEILDGAGYNRDRGYQSLAVDNGSSGINFALCLNPVLVICDIAMPGFDGDTVLSQLRNQGRETPFVFVTARATQADIAKGKELGASEYIVKPFTNEQLLKAVKHLIAEP
jgi:CheY-like chemotaxis protein